MLRPLNLLLLGAGSESKKDTIDEEEDDDDDDDDVPDLVENFDEASKNEEKAAEAKGKLLLQTTVVSCQNESFSSK